jgi:hypothetical protein
MATRGSAEHKRRIAAGVRRAHARRRAVSDPRPAHVDRWLQGGEVPAELRTILEIRASQVEAMVQDLGGADEVSGMERALLDGWLKATVAADVEFMRLVRGDTDGAPERLATYLNTARANLTSLGIRRRTRPVMSIDEYLHEDRG